MKYSLFISLSLTVLALISCKNDPKPTLSSGEPGIDPELASLNALLEKEPNNDSLLFRRASLYYQLDAFDEALADAGKAIQLDSMQPEYYHLLADTYLDYARPNDSKRAIGVLQIASDKFPNRFPTLLKLAEFQLIVRQHSDALTTIDRIMKQDPQNADAYYMAGRIALDKGDTTNALGMFRKCTRFDATHADGWLSLGIIASNRRDPLAVQYFDNILRLDSTNLQARELKGAFLKKQGKFNDAFAVYRDIIRKNPDYSNAYFDMGTIYLEQDSVAKAYDNFNIAIKTDPLFIRAYYYRGHCAELQHQLEAAYEDYRQAAGMSPNFTEAVDARDRLKKQLGK
ncbi:MAG: tetratricopeptide repeat protein [Saprospiraceae bacterium]|nr:tetratricopeptide repeat protein [Saprospiraceae bacterium]